jgi:hypothetical protein
LFGDADMNHLEKSFTKLQYGNLVKKVFLNEVTQETPEILQIELESLQKHPLDQNVRFIGE